MLKWLKISLIGVMLLGVLFVDPYLSWASQKDQIEKDLIRKRKDLKDIKHELSKTKEKEKKIRGQESSILESLQKLDGELYQREKELKQMEARLAQTKAKLHQIREQILRLNGEMEKTREELFSRLRAIYRMGKTPREVYLLSSESYLDYLKINKYLRAIVDSDSRLIETYREQLALKERYQNELIEDQKQLERNRFEVERKKEEVQRIRIEKQDLLKSIQTQKIVYQKLIAELEERSRELQALIQKLEREKSALAYGKTKPLAYKGKLDPPVHGKVISLFKEKGQNGIEIQAPMGAEVRAILPGKVLFADWFKGFGNLIIIDHGDGTFTISGYCSQLLKKIGDEVEKGEVIALVGNVGSIKGPSLYFEVRYQGKPQNPLDWISPGEKIVSLPEGEGEKMN